ncbi:probable E3 ubiquitin-protein ligase ATL44 [Phragmites australis]|uniref:probable E3 ubiquitin-protein ligase ATL44 n=1 Tax=Phragmites australis TaxID=29695 RepID=UPI002D781A1A|nr:probable E3 ubiquitin-protein ligase ATL44 [Phragmites australis]
MLRVHRARLLAASRAAPDGVDDDDSRVCYAIAASVVSLMLLCGILSVLPSPRAFVVTKAYVIIGVPAVMLVLTLIGWLVAPGIGALVAWWAPAAAPAPARLARHLCACGLTVAAVGTFAYEAPAANDEGEPRQSCVLCAVCLEDVRAGEMVRQLPACRHMFHADCVDAWLRSHRTCPLCRCELPPQTVGAKAAAALSSPSPDALPPV